MDRTAGAGWASSSRPNVPAGVRRTVVSRGGGRVGVAVVVGGVGRILRRRRIVRCAGFVGGCLVRRGVRARAVSGWGPGIGFGGSHGSEQAPGPGQQQTAGHQSTTDGGAHWRAGHCCPVRSWRVAPSTTYRVPPGPPFHRHDGRLIVARSEVAKVAVRHRDRVAPGSRCGSDDPRRDIGRRARWACSASARAELRAVPRPGR